MKKLLILLLFPSLLWATIHYVETTGTDATPCSQGSPCLTIQYATNQTSNGDTVMIGAGTFNEKVSMGNHDSLAYIGEGPGNTMVNGTDFCFYGYDRNYVRIESLQAYSADSMILHFPLEGSDMSRFYFINLLLRDTPNGSEHNGIGIYYAPKYIYMDNVTIRNIGYNGMRISGSNTIMDSIFLYNCTVESTGVIELYQQCAGYWEIHNTHLSKIVDKGSNPYPHIQAYSGEVNMKIKWVIDSLWVGDGLKGLINFDAHSRTSGADDTLIATNLWLEGENDSAAAVTIRNWDYAKLGNVESYNCNRAFEIRNVRLCSLYNYSAWGDTQNNIAATSENDTVTYVFLNQIQSTMRANANHWDFSGGNAGTWQNCRYSNSVLHSGGGLNITGNASVTVADTQWCDPQYTDTTSSPPDLSISTSASCVCGNGYWSDDIGRYDCPSGIVIKAILGRVKLGAVRLP